ncbi:MAG: hypothetical protein Q8R53_00835 [Nanoarchaeota archaeon]|nr:hypothetical protein [Nanoarchaeota archaeon]
MTASRGKLVVYGVLFLALLAGFARFLLLTGERAFSYELAGLVALSLLMLLGCVGYGRAWGERVFLFFFVLSMGNVVAIWYFFGSLYMTLLLLAALGFLLSVVSIPKSAEQPVFSGQSPKDAGKADGKGETTKTPPPEKETKIEVKHTPGKYVASTRGTVYHAPKCEWARKISRNGRVWFSRKEEAVEKGFKAHGCVE